MKTKELKEKILNALDNNSIHNIKEAEKFIEKYENGELEQVSVKWKITFSNEDSIGFTNDKELIDWCNEQREAYFSRG